MYRLGTWHQRSEIVFRKKDVRPLEEIGNVQRLRWIMLKSLYRQLVKAKRPWLLHFKYKSTHRLSNLFPNSNRQTMGFSKAEPSSRYLRKITYQLANAISEYYSKRTTSNKRCRNHVSWGSTIQIQGASKDNRRSNQSFVCILVVYKVFDSVEHTSKHSKSML